MVWKVFADLVNDSSIIRICFYDPVDLESES